MVLLIAENIVAVGHLAQREAVRNDVVEGHIAIGHVLQRLVDVLVRGSLAAAQRDAFVEKLAHREGIEGRGVHAGHEHVAAAARGAHANEQDFGRAFVEVDNGPGAVGQVAIGLKAHGFHAHVSVLALAYASDFVHHLLVVRPEDAFGVSCLLGLVEAVLLGVDDDDATGPTQPGRFGGHDAHRTGPENGDDFAAPHIGPVDARVAGGKNISEEKHPVRR